MSLIDGQDKLQELQKAFGGNRYAVVRYVASEARKLMSKYNNVILESEAISWFLTGEIPKSIQNGEHLKPKRSQAISYTDEVLSYVTDKDVCHDVRSTIKHSRQISRLEFIYTCVKQDSGKQARIRILSRMIWAQITTNI